MKRALFGRRLLASAGCAALFVGGAIAAEFDIPSGNLAAALDAYSAQAGVPVVVSANAVKNIQSTGLKGAFSAPDALSRLLKGTGFAANPSPSGVVEIVNVGRKSSTVELAPIQLAQATSPTHTAVETVTVTSSKLGGADVQSVPIAITALSQEQLTSTQTAGGPDLIKQVPNMTFTKTNFSGYSIQIRGIGTQAISVTTDPAVAVAFNDTPFIRNHFFEQEFFDVAQVEVLRGPQGTLYGRNATAGVVNLISAKPTDQFEAMASGELGNYHQRRLEGMINLPIVDDRLDLRIAGEWTKRQGYSFDETTNQRIDGRDLWSARATLAFKPTENLQAQLIWEHFQENDDRLRSAKQLCKTDPGPGEIDGVAFPIGPGVANTNYGNYVSQGCLPTSLYSPDAFEAPNGYTLPYVTPAQTIGPAANGINPYGDTTQSPNLRIIESIIEPVYKAKNDTVELNTDYQLTQELTFTSQSGFGQDFIYSLEDYNRFGSEPGYFNAELGPTLPDGSIDQSALLSPGGVFCDPQLGCSNALLAADLSKAHSWQMSQEFRLSSRFDGPLNFSVGGNYLHYETEENYYVFFNSITLFDARYDSEHPWIAGVSDNTFNLPQGFQYNDPTRAPTIAYPYIDPNPISRVNDNGHNYFLSKNPYTLNSYAVFGEANYAISPDVKLTGGLRWTEDRKHFSLIPSWLTAGGWGYPVAGVVNQQWDEITGRFVANWAPKLDFTDQTLNYASYSHGYKAGGANPPGAIFFIGNAQQPTHPLTFKPEFIDAFEIGTKNTLLDGALTINASAFYYNYENYQVSQIVDRTAINLNFDAHDKGAELEAVFEPLPGLRFNFSGGWQDTAIARGQQAVDLMDRTAGHAGWYVKKPYVTEASNCIFPEYVIVAAPDSSPYVGDGAKSYCSYAYIDHVDPVTGLPYVANPSVSASANFRIPAGYPGYDPSVAPNDGAGFSKDLGGNKLPNSPPFTASLGAQYTMPLTPEWAGTFRADGYWQDNSWWRVFNDLEYDKLHGYATLNLTLILTSQSGWQVMLYDKNVLNTTAITGAFLNSDDSGLTTNVFLTDPKLIGLRVTKNW